MGRASARDSMADTRAEPGNRKANWWAHPGSQCPSKGSKERERRRGRGGEGEGGRERGRGLTFEEVAHAGIVVDGVRDSHDHLDDFLGDRVVGGGLPSENDHPWHDLLDHSAREVSAASVRAFYA